MKKKLSIFLIIILAAGMLCAGGYFAAKTAIRLVSVADSRLSQILTAVRQQSKTSQSIKSELLSAIVGEKQYYTFDYAWTEQASPLIAHAGGGIGGQAYTNSLDAIRHNYALGHRIFEIDFDLTGEYLLVAAHDEDDWREMSGVSDDTPFSNAAFEDALLCGQYTSMTIADVIDLMAEYPDIYIITDTKHTDKTSILLQFSQLVKYAQSHHPRTLQRIIPQIYNEDMYEYVMNVYPFRSMIYTLYQADWTPDSVYAFCEETGIGFVTMPWEEADADAIRLWKELDVRTAVHTLNDEAAAQEMLAMGVDMIYTDYLAPEVLP